MTTAEKIMREALEEMARPDVKNEASQMTGPEVDAFYTRLASDALKRADEAKSITMTTMMSLLFVLGLSLLIFVLWLLWQIALSVPLGF